MAGNPLEIMIVDDETIVGKRLRVALEKDGYAVEVFDTGQSAIDRLQSKIFDIVVTDVRIDEVDGLQILDAVRSSSPTTKTIMITGYATVEMAREALAKGAFDFIAKPFMPKDLRKVIERAARELTSQQG
jgi:DNA-binding NtrC family response regulator